MKRLLLILVLLKAFLLILFCLYGPLRLGPDEAQYWTWSKDLSLGYYSKPPGIAYQIALGTLFFGDTELGVRIVSILLGIVTPLLIWHLAKLNQLEDRTAFWAALIWAFSPLGFAGSLFAITDGGMILFWILALIVLLEKRPLWQLGVMIGLGALFKWPLYLFWLLALPFVRLDKEFFAAVCLSLLGLLPALIWNWQHDFATFKHVGATLQGGSSRTQNGDIFKGNFWEFIGAQVALLSPIFFWFLIVGYRKKEKTLSFAYLWTFLPLAMGVLVSLFMKVQGNWMVMAYPTAVLIAADGGKDHPRWLQAGLALSIGLVIGALFFLPLKHNKDWDQLAPLLTEAGYNPRKDFLFTDKYQNTSLASFYGPGQKRAYFLNLRGDRLNQFSFWPSLKQKEKGKTGYYVNFDNNEPELTSYFEKVDSLGFKPLGKKKVLIIKGSNYNGHEVENSLKY